MLPVPLATPGLRDRGYNRAWVLARGLAAEFRRPADAELPQRNLRAAFMVDPRRRARLQGRRVALVDDLMTAGATAREAAAILPRAGAAAVDVWVLARKPED